MAELRGVVDQALDLLRRRSPDAFEIYVDESLNFSVESKDGRLDTLEASRSWGMAIRVLTGHRMGFSYTTSSSSSPLLPLDTGGGLERMIEDAMAGAAAVSPDPCLDFAPPLERPLPELLIFDESLERIPEEAKIEVARRLEETARSVDPARIKKVRKASYQDVLSHKSLINSNGLEVSRSSTFASVSVTAIAEESGESEVGWDFDFSHFAKDLDIERVGRTAGEKALGRLKGEKVPTGTYPVLLENHVASDFLSLLAHAFLAEQVQKGKSPLRGRKGERLFSPLVSIVDDGLLPKGAGTSAVDGEGTPTGRTYLAREGEVLGFLYDRYWANRERAANPSGRAASTGNSRRPGIKSPPGLGVSNFFVEPGSGSLSALLGDLGSGIVVEDVMGLHTVDPISGDFSLGCSGGWVTGARRVHPVKSIAVAGNLFDLFGRVERVGEDLRFFGKIGSPSLLVSYLPISGK